MNNINKLKRLLTYSTCILNIFFFIIMWSNYQNYVLVNRFSFIIIVLLNIGLFIFYLPDLINKNKGLFLFLVSILILSFSNALFVDAGIGSLIVLIFTLCLIIQFKYYKINRKILIYITGGLFGFFMYFIFYRDNRLNSNTIGYIIFLLGMYSCLFLELINSNKLFKIILLIVIVCNILDTDSRGALLGVITFIILGYVISDKVWSKKYIYYIIAFFITIGSIIFTIVYVEMWKSNIQINLSFNQKSLYTGREAIWNEVLYLIGQNYLTGIGSKTTISSFTEFNLHNSMLNVMATYGVPIFILFSGVTIGVLSDIRKVISSNSIYRIATAGVIGVCIVGFFETNLMWTNVSYLTYFFIAIIFSLKNTNN